ncbi:MAG: CoB--CoM heterodisulfide reductase iron-sulfur subunit A family protein [Chloroflexi bacterium]|nr:CoB--CoM heterodisulfide reductase iron-sulfur subunit A family protein [Chloroflexota bacterium]
MLSDFEGLFPITRLTERALVIGGGIAGIEAALSLAEMGIEVVLLERQPSLGGRMAQLDKLFPTLDHAVCNLRDRMDASANHPNVRLLTYARVERVDGYVGDFEVTFRLRVRKVRASACDGCGKCWRHCPVKVTSEFDEGMGRRSAIYIPFPQAIPSVPVVDEASCLHFSGEDCRICADVCPTGCVDFDQEDSTLTERFGAIVVATGLSLSDPSVYAEYGFGRYPDVVTSLQLERSLNSAGPTRGEVYRPSNGARPEKVVLVCCVGAGDSRAGRSYPSPICCINTIKQAVLLKRVCGRAEVYVVHEGVRQLGAGKAMRRGLQLVGKGGEELLQRACEEPDIHFVGGKVCEVQSQGTRLVMRLEETESGAPMQIESDLVVLAPGVEGNEFVEELADLLGLPADHHGFLIEADSKLRPVESSIEGIFLAGAVTGPRDIAECVAQAGAAAAKVAGLFRRLAKAIDASPLHMV